VADRLVVVWRVTETCNLSCAFCRYDRRQPFERKSADRERVLAIGELLAEHQRRSGISVHVSFLGGEPLLWPPFVDIVRAFRHDFSLGTGVTTNGTLVGSPEIFRAVLDAIDELTVSIDGFAAFHDRVRGWPGGFERLRRSMTDFVTAKRQLGRGPLLRANMVLMRENIDDFASLAHELARIGFDELTFNQLGGNDRPEFFALHRLLPAQVEHFVGALPALRSELAEIGLNIRGSASYLERISASTHERRLPVSDCAPGERFLYLTEAGIASPCSFTADTLGVPLASPRIGELSVAFRGARSRSKSCADCPSTRVFGKFA